MTMAASVTIPRMGQTAIAHRPARERRREQPTAGMTGARRSQHQQEADRTRPPAHRRVARGEATRTPGTMPTTTCTTVVAGLLPRMTLAISAEA